MDLLCDTVMVEEILPRLRPKCLLRFGATARRYNALARRPDFAARYWRRAGVFLQPAGEQRKQGALPAPRFLTAPACQAAALVPGADLADDGLAIVHSAAGGLLLLCSRGPTWPAARYFVCNPVTQQRAALPELRSLGFKTQCALLTVAGGGAASRFEVVVIEQWQMEDMFLELKVFSSDTGRWKARSLSLAMRPSLPWEHDFRRRPELGQSGAAYWIQRGGGGGGDDDDKAIAYHSASGSLRVIHLPRSRHAAGKPEHCCIGEGHGGDGGGGLRYARADSSAFEVWDSETMEGRAWTLAHRVGVAELPEGLNSDAAGYRRCIKPVGFHPTDVDAVFLALPAGGVAAYSMEHGTMNLHDCFATRADVFPYVHPPCPGADSSGTELSSGIVGKEKQMEPIQRTTRPRRPKDESTEHTCMHAQCQGNQGQPIAANKNRSEIQASLGVCLCFA